MNYVIESCKIRYAIDEMGNCVSFVNKLTGKEYIKEPAHTWKMIVSFGQRAEIPVFAEKQTNAVVEEKNGLTLTYPTLKADGRQWPICLSLHFGFSETGALAVTASIENQSELTVNEIIITAAAGIHTISGDVLCDKIMWPRNFGVVIEKPAVSDLSTYSGYRKYERHDFLHTDLDLNYPRIASMSWYDLYCEDEGLYVGITDQVTRTVCLHVERDIHKDILLMGLCRYPFVEKGESFEAEPITYDVHRGDWHAGSKIYLASQHNQEEPSDVPAWARNMEGWLRCIMKPHHCEINWDYSQIPALWDDAASGGLDTLFLLGWEKGGFARMWPDFYADDTPRSEDPGSLGTIAELRAGIDYVHQHGGKVVLFVSYFLIDHKSEFYLKEGGDKCTIKGIWGEDIPFAETYCGEATYRKLPNLPMPMYGACPGSDTWQEKMYALADYCFDLGADGILYDLGGMPPYLCFSKDHDHKKPDMAVTSKAERFRLMREHVKSFGDDKIMLQEHLCDITNQHIDITQGSRMNPRNPLENPDMYRYTFPKYRITNRELGEDEDDYRYRVNFTFVYDFAFDMTIFRCCGTLADIPNYAVYLKEIIALRREYADYLHEGIFRDQDGITVENGIAKVYEAADGRLGCAVWNPADEKAEVVIRTACGKEYCAALDANSVCFIEMK